MFSYQQMMPANHADLAIEIGLNDAWRPARQCQFLSWCGQRSDRKVGYEPGRTFMHEDARYSYSSKGQGLVRGFGYTTARLATLCAGYAANLAGMEEWKEVLNQHRPEMINMGQRRGGPSSLWGLRNSGGVGWLVDWLNAEACKTSGTEGMAHQVLYQES